MSGFKTLNKFAIFHIEHEGFAQLDSNDRLIYTENATDAKLFDTTMQVALFVKDKGIIMNEDLTVIDVELRVNAYPQYSVDRSLTVMHHIEEIRRGDHLPKKKGMSASIKPEEPEEEKERAEYNPFDTSTNEFL